MTFKPLISEEEFRLAEAEIEAAAAEVADVSSSRNEQNNEPARVHHVQANLKLTPKAVPAVKTLLAAFGFDRGRKRIETYNRIVRTLSLGLESGLMDNDSPDGGKEYMLAMKLYAICADQRTKDDELSVILGWMQAIVSMNCQGITLERVRAA